jgi:hypothetical protein
VGRGNLVKRILKAQAEACGYHIEYKFFYPCSLIPDLKLGLVDEFRNFLLTAPDYHEIATSSFSM